MTRLLFNLTLAIGLLPGAAMAGEKPASVTATYSSSEVVITNRHGRGICYAVHEMDLLRRIEWGPACSLENRIAPDGVERVPITGKYFEPSGEVLVSWWFDDNHGVDGNIQLKAR